MDLGFFATRCTFDLRILWFFCFCICFMIPIPLHSHQEWCLSSSPISSQVLFLVNLNSLFIKFFNYFLSFFNSIKKSFIIYSKIPNQLQIFLFSIQLFHILNNVRTHLISLNNLCLLTRITTSWLIFILGKLAKKSNFLVK